MEYKQQTHSPLITDGSLLKGNIADVLHHTSGLLYDGTLDLLKAQEWAAAYPDYVQPALKKIINNLMYIDKQRFFSCFENSVALFKKQTIGKELRCFDFCGPYGKQKSNYRMSMLLIDRRLPGCGYVDIAPNGNNSSFYNVAGFADEYKHLIDDIRQNKVKDIVVCDDASYSGQQLGHELFAIAQLLKHYDMTGCRIHVICPFMTHGSKEHITQFLVSRDVAGIVNISYYDVHTIPLLSDLLSKQQLHELTAFGGDVGWKKPGEKGYTYFWHKIPDQLSFPEAITKGKIPYTRDTLPFMNRPVSPYKP